MNMITLITVEEVNVPPLVVVILAIELNPPTQESHFEIWRILAEGLNTWSGC